MAARSTSTLAMAKTSADAAMFFKNSVVGLVSLTRANFLALSMVNLSKHRTVSLGPIGSDDRSLAAFLRSRKDMPACLTLNRGLGAHGGNGAEGTDHEVLVRQVLLWGGLGGIFAEVGDLGGLALALEGGLVGAGGIGADGSRAEAPGDAGRRSGHCTRQGASGRCEGRHGFVEMVERRRIGGDDEVEVFSKLLTAGNRWSLESKTCA